MKDLVLYVGKYDPEETHRRVQDRCCANTKFWRPFVDGDTFPDLKSLEVRHIWATIPPETATLDLTPLIHAGLYRNPPPELILQSDGLAKLETIRLESPPELDSMIFRQLVGNPKTSAANLTRLDLRFCFLNNDTIAELLYKAPPGLRHLSLICGLPDNRDVLSMKTEEPTHLCPLLREYSKRLERLDYASNRVCQQIFFSEEEIGSLEASGAIHYGALGTVQDMAAEVDSYAIKATIQGSRQKEKKASRGRSVQEAIHKAAASPGSRLSGQTSISGIQEARVRHDTEMRLDDEEEQRRRLIGRSDKEWMRRIISFGSPCRFGEPWAGMQAGADLEEEGIEWVLASMCMILWSFRRAGD